MKYIKLFESIHDERLAEETWGIDPFELRDIVQMCIEDCGVFCEFEIYLGISSILQFDRWGGGKYDSEQFSSLFKVFPDRIERDNGMRAFSSKDCVDEALKDGKYLKICVFLIGEEAAIKVVDIRNSINERLSAFGAGYSGEFIEWIGNDSVEIVFEKEINI